MFARKNHKVTFLISYFCMTKRRVQGGEATSERRRRDGSQSIPLFVLFVLFGQAKRTLKEKNHKETFPFSYFCMTKSTKSQQGGLAPSSFQTTGGVHESVAQAMRGKYVRQMIKRKPIVLRLSAISYYHACEHITRDSRADSCTHCLHAR